MEVKNRRIYCYSCQLCRTAEIAGTVGTKVDTLPPTHTKLSLQPLFALLQVHTKLRIGSFLLSFLP